jgi:hypothetical protein
MDVGTRKLLVDLAEVEAVHERTPGRAARASRSAGRVGDHGRSFWSKEKR